jgi:hypothetical protein
MSAVLSRTIDAREGMITIEPGHQLLENERIQAITLAIQNYWQSLLNYTHHLGT